MLAVKNVSKKGNRMPSLFMVMLGGRHARANTEVHDVVFAVADSLEESYPQLKNAWFGEQKGLHIDAWMQVEGVESAGKKYQIQFSDAQPQAEDEKLWLINLGGYDTREFGELHRYVLVVAPHAADIIHELALAVKYGLTARQVAETPHAFLSWSEAVRVAAGKLV